MTATTRSSARKENGQDSAAPPASEAEPGTKHKPDGGEVKDGHATKRIKTSGRKSRKSLEETRTSDEGKNASKEHNEDRGIKHEESAVLPHGRDPSTEPVPSSILEKGIIYFFFRGRVNNPDPSSVDEIARSFIVLRPIEKDAKLTSGPIGDAGNSRLCIIPKKVLPQSGRDRWIAWVEKAGASFQQLKEEFLSSSEYTTKTAGSRTKPPATPIGEGVYAITSTGRESHLAYMLTLPEKPGEVQTEIGLREKDSFIITTKNPEFPSNSNAGQPPKAPEYPEEIQEEFRGRRWMPTQPKHLDFPGTQFLMIGENSGVQKALEPQAQDVKEGAEEPAEEMEKLEEEDTKRMRGLSKDDSVSIFTDLEVNARDYPKLQTTF